MAGDMEGIEKEEEGDMGPTVNVVKSSPVVYAKARGRYQTFYDRIEDLMRFKDMYGDINVAVSKGKSLFH